MDNKYKRKYDSLRSYMIYVIHENAALFDEISILQKKVVILREECNILSKQLQVYKEDSKSSKQSSKGETSNKTSILKRRLEGHGSSAQQPSSASISSRTKKIRRSYKKKKEREMVQPQHDACGQVVFPITLKDFEIHSLGEIIYDKPAYHTEDFIYPVGFCSTHVYGSVRYPQMKCIYTCKISDGGHFPRFEISSDGEDGVCFVGKTPDECHLQLITMINQRYNTSFLSAEVNRGADFFGLSHPTVHYLITSLSGVLNCVKYNKKRFDERKKALEKDVNLKQTVEASIYYEALLKCLPHDAVENPNWFYK